MPDLNDFYAFKSTSEGGGGSGCSVPIIAIGIIALLLMILGKCAS